MILFNIIIVELFNHYLIGFIGQINIGALSSLITMNIEKYHSFWLAYLIPLIAFFGAIIVLFVGRPPIHTTTTNWFIAYSSISCSENSYSAAMETRQTEGF